MRNIKIWKIARQSFPVEDIGGYVASLTVTTTPSGPDLVCKFFNSSSTAVAPPIYATTTSTTTTSFTVTTTTTTTTNPLVLKDLGNKGCTVANPCTVCQSDCDTDAECMGDLICFQTESGEMPPGCIAGE